MDIFISWSGVRSRAIAEAIRDWLPKIMNSVKPWMSQSDISKGSRWNPDVSQNLDTAKAGIFCLTPSNLSSESILFEAGAISKSVNESRVYTLLAGVEVANLKWPLAQFQATSLQKDDFRKMLSDINNDLIRLEEPSSPQAVLEEAFDLWWPKLDAKFSTLPPDASSSAPGRTQKEILEEILELARSQARASARQDAAAMQALRNDLATISLEQAIRLDEVSSMQRELQLLLIRHTATAGTAYPVTARSSEPSGSGDDPASTIAYSEREFQEKKARELSRALIQRKVGRNEPCPCGSGKRYKVCHGVSA